MKTQLKITFTRPNDYAGEVSGSIPEIRNYIFGIISSGGKIITNKKFNCGG